MDIHADSETLKIIQKTAVDAASAGGKILLVKAEELGEGKVMIGKPDGSYEIKQRVERRNHALGDLASVWDWVKYSTGALGAKPVVWLGDSAIRIVIDDTATDAPSPLIYYQFQPTPEYAKLLDLSKGEKVFDQRSFVAMLRQEFWDCLDINKRDQWVKALRALQSSETGAAKSEVGSRGASYGRDIDQSVSSKHGDLPDSLTLQVRLFQDVNLATRQPIECDLEINPTTFKITLSPIKSDLAEALANELADIRAILVKNLPEGTPIFRGSYSPVK